MEGLDVDGIFQHYRLNPTEVEAVTYYLPRLLSGDTLHGAEKLIHDVEISGCEPKDLAARYAPAPQAAGSGDRFFFTTSKSKNGSKLQSVRTAGGGTTIQKTTQISHAGSKVGEVKNLSFKKKGKSTGWVMEEYRCLLPEATVAEGVKVFCRMHLAQHAPAAVRQESAAYKLPELQPEAVTASTHAQKRMRVPTSSFTAAAPVFLPDESIPEAEDDMGRLSCSMEELLGLQVDETLMVGATKNMVPLEAEENVEQSHYSEPDEELKFLLDEAAAEQEQQAVSTNEKLSMVQGVGSYKPPVIFSHPSEAEWQADEALGKDGEADGFDIEELERLMESGEALGKDGEADGFDIEELERMMESGEALGKDGEADGFDIEELERMMESGEALGKEKRYNAAPDGEADGFDIEELERMMDQQEPLCLDALDQGTLEDMLQSDYPVFHDAEKEKSYNAAPDVHAPSLQGHDHSFKPRPCSHDPFEAAWKAEEALENEKRNNAAANLLGGYNNFFSSARGSVH
ncbi:hypothetical protein ZWY2020_049482 [Hordeum vulgare]|nr:hypothetical protein ZWY2020_049482 [Hordeum vulgare]